jgi:hypothetical protein
LRPSWRWFLFIVLAVCAGYWKLLFHGQYSMLLGYESTNQAYAWNHYAASAIHRWLLPLWDPYGHSGQTLIGMMAPGTFYPPKILLYLWPFDAQGHSSTWLFHVFYLLTAAAGAWFMFLLARDLGLHPFPAYFAGIVFAIGGFVGRIVWPHLHDGAIWLPLLLLFAGRALRAPTRKISLQWASAAGLCLGMTVLSGALHIVMMQGFALVGLCAYFGMRRDCEPRRAIEVLLVASAVAGMAGAVQLLPSVEYSKVAMRYLGGANTQMSGKRIPYDLLDNNFFPRAILGFFIGYPFGGGGELQGTYEITPYLGLLPILLAIAGVWKNWAQAWVRYLAGLALLSFSYAMGGFSLLHGLMYAVIPYVWLAREPGRFVHLTHFALALLAGFGCQTLFESEAVKDFFSRPLRVLGWIVVGAAGILTVPAFLAVPAIPEWSYLALWQLILAFGLLAAIVFHGWRGKGARFLLVALTLADLEAVNWTIRDIRQMPPDLNYLQILFDSKPLANFLKAQQGIYRLHFEADWMPSVGEFYDLDTTGGMAPTDIFEYSHFLINTPRSLDMMNVRYLIRNSNRTEPGPVYADRLWKVYEIKTHVFERAWMVNKAIVETTHYDTVKEMQSPEFNPERMAVTADPVNLPPATEAAAIPAHISFDRRDENHIDMTVKPDAPGLLVLSEIFYPGWHASINGQTTPIHKVDGVLRGVVLPAGESHVKFWYAPLSVYGGGAITLLCFAGVIGWFVVSRPE